MYYDKYNLRLTTIRDVKNKLKNLKESKQL